MQTRFASTLAAFVSLAPITAGAAEYTQVAAAQSSIAFSYQQMGVKMDGLDVDLASVDTGAPEGDQEVAGKPWFDTRAFPSARFVSGAVKPLGGNRYEVAGKLSIKGRTQDVVVPATFTAQGNAGVFDGTFTIRRADFSIGEGTWAKFDIVANDVQVKFRITAVPGK